MTDRATSRLPLSTPILVTGGSGFIGTNVVEHLADRGFRAVRNLDVAAPRIREHADRWIEGDIRRRDDIDRAVHEFGPQVIVHLAGRTDLGGTTVDDYEANTLGVEHVLDAVRRAAGTVQRVLFASSQLVCVPGHTPIDEFDYCPPNAYGESKVIGEQLVRERAGDEFTWVLLRPTTIWGPWWGSLYSTFFRTVRAGRYVHPRGVRVSKAFGYVGNTAHQLETLISCPAEAIHGRMLYLSDYEPYPVLEWAQEIADQFGARRIREVPVGVLRALARGGDALKRLGVDDPPITSYRLFNMLTATRFDMAPLDELCGPLPYSRAEGTAATVAWMRSFPC